MIEFIRTKPFPIRKDFVAISPFRGNMALLKKTLQDYKKGETQIGFTWISSMKSMGLIPRSHGKYELGQKYKTQITN